MSAAPRWPLILGAMLCSVLALSGCAFSAKAKQEQRAASIHRAQVEEAADANADSKADKQRKAKQDKQSAQQRRVQAALIARGDPDSLAAAALFERVLSGFTSPNSVDLATRAVTGAPGRPDLLFVLLQLCSTTKDCNPAPLEVRLRQLDPDNGITWAYTLARADRARNDQDWAAGREAMSQTLHMALYWNGIVSHLAAAAAKAGLDPQDALVQVIGIEAAFQVALQPVSKACSTQEVQQPPVLAQCRRIATAFRRGDTMLLESYGSSLAARLYPAGSAEAQEVATERRALHYRMDLMTRNSVKVNSPQAVRSLANLLGRNTTEQSAFRALYVQLGLTPDPPAQWVDNWPGG